MDPAAPSLAPAPGPRGPAPARRVLTRAESVELARLSPAGWAMHRSRGKWIPARHLLMLNRAIVETVTTGGRLAVSFPPGHGKSELLSRSTPPWYVGVWPEKRVLLTSYGADLAVGFSKLGRSDFEEHGPEVFGLTVSEDSSAGKHWTVDGHEGGVDALGVGGGLTGQHPDLLIVDDPVGEAEDVFSPRARDGLWEWWQSKASNRLKKGGAVIVLMTRWNEDDLVGRLTTREKDRWRVVNLPAICEDPATDPLQRRLGGALWPEMYDEEALAKQKVSSGSYWWNAQYQGRPAPREGGMVKRAWWKTFKGSPQEQAAKCSVLLQSWDMAFKETTDGSYVVGGVWGLAGADRFLLDVVRARMEFTGMVSAVRSLSAKWPRAMTKLVEDKANGPAVVSTLQHEIPGLMPWPPKGERQGSKESRMAARTPEIEAGNCYLPDPLQPGCDWVHDFVEELAAFPRGANDDQVDMTSQALEYLARGAQIRFVISM